MTTATLQPFRSKSFVLFLLAAFVLLCMPTVSIGDNFLTSESSSLAHDVPNSVKATKRANVSKIGKAAFAVLLILIFRFIFTAYPSYSFPARRCVSLPLYLPELRKLLLMPLKLTTSLGRI
ncbi:hypothetical protein [Cohnella cellulosilytica]|uniref:Transmembrane protein n=1 Tax=Cohnella cellulosilytica TaxID=986710 RepID=A0ABW2FCY5_9BACL